MTTKIRIRPTKPSAEQLRHPVDGPMRKAPDGSFFAMWSYDTFTMRRTHRSFDRACAGAASQSGDRRAWNATGRFRDAAVPAREEPIHTTGIVIRPSR